MACPSLRTHKFILRVPEEPWLRFRCAPRRSPRGLIGNLMIQRARDQPHTPHQVLDFWASVY